MKFNVLCWWLATLMLKNYCYFHTDIYSKFGGLMDLIFINRFSRNNRSRIMKKCWHKLENLSKIVDIASFQYQGSPQFSKKKLHKPMYNYQERFFFFRELALADLTLNIKIYLILSWIYQYAGLSSSLKILLFFNLFWINITRLIQSKPLTFSVD